VSPRAAQVDGNQRAIVEALRRVGATVQHLHEVGKGCPDLAVGFRQQNFLLEVKTAEGQLEPAQVLWHGTWRGRVAVVRTAEQALRAIGAIR
jgi:hypothetical protein